MTRTDSSVENPSSNDSENLTTTVNHLENAVEDLTNQLTATKTTVTDLRNSVEALTQQLQDLQLQISHQAEAGVENKLASATTLNTALEGVNVIGAEQQSLDHYNRYKALIPQSRYYVERDEALRLPRLQQKPQLGDLVIIGIKSASKADRVPQLGIIGVISKEPRRTSDFVEIEVYCGKTYQKKYTSLAKIDPNSIEYPKAHCISETEWQRLM